MSMSLWPSPQAGVQVDGKKMKVTDYRLEFYGLCRECQ